MTGNMFDDMKLSRRDAIVALGGIAGGAAVVGSARRDELTDFDEAGIVSRLHAAAEAIYPSTIDVEESFIETYVRGRLASREEHLAGQAEALEIMEARAQGIAGRPYSRLQRDRRRTVLRTMGVHRAPPVADGTAEERVRYYIVNDLLYVLFTTPKGAEAVGFENPPGYPGGREAYRRRPVQ